MIRPSWTGVYPAITTQFDSEGSVDFTMFFSNLDFQERSGIDGVILGGSLGEASTLSSGEKIELLERTLDHCGDRLPVLLNIAEQTTREAVSLAEKAEEYGASGLMLLPPMRYKADDREVLTFLDAVATSTSLPILLYNNPVDYGIEITVDMLERLLVNRNIQAIKESTRNTVNVTHLRNAFADRLAILCGVDPLAFDELVLGADGWVAGLVNAFPEETVAMYRLLREGRVGEARLINRWFLPLLLLDVHPKFVQYIKLAEQMVGVGSETVRPPRLPLVAEERGRIEDIVRSALASRPAVSRT